MKYIITLIFIVLSSMILSGQDSTKSESETTKIIQLPSETLNISVENKTEKQSGFDTQKNMPWIGAILIGILTVAANYIINRQIRKTNTESLDKQLENARFINKIDFNKTVLSGNRQVWINDLRNIISELLSKILGLLLKKEVTYEEFQELTYLITKTELMLNPEKDKDFIEALEELQVCFIEIQSDNIMLSDIKKHINIVKNFTKKTLKTEWERVKKGE